MNVCLVLLAWTVGCPAPASGAPDRWLAEDKAQHFTVSIVATTLGYGTARLALDRRGAAVAAGAAALAAGIAKEVADVRGGGPFSLRDLAWDAAGVALGLTLALNTR